MIHLVTNLRLESLELNECVYSLYCTSFRLANRPVKSEWREQQFGAFLGCIRVLYFWFPFCQAGIWALNRNRGETHKPARKTVLTLIYPCNVPNCCSHHSDLTGLVCTALSFSLPLNVPSLPFTHASVWCSHNLWRLATIKGRIDNM